MSNGELLRQKAATYGSRNPLISAVAGFQRVGAQAGAKVAGAVFGLDPTLGAADMANGRTYGYPVNGGGGFSFDALPSSSGPGQVACALAGLPPTCTWVDLALAGAGALAGGSEPASGGSSLVDTTKCPEGQFGYPPACFDLQPGGATQGGGMVVTTGEAVMGRYGAALQPMARTQTTLRCLPGMVLGTDSLCYNKRDLRKDERKWVPGRKPLLTGGDLNAISRAARAAARVKTQQRRLEKLGLLKKPSRGRGRGSPGVITKSEAAKALRS